MKGKKTLIIVLFILAIIASGICFVGLYKDVKMYKNAENIYTTFRQTESIPTEKKPALVYSQYEELQIQYPGMIGFIKSKDNAIAYPVMQGLDNAYYLTHMANGEKNPLGSIFLDYNAEPDFTSNVSVIYGHHAKNEMMFGALERYKEKAYFEQYSSMELYGLSKQYELEIQGVYLVDGSSESYPPPDASIEEREAFLKEVKNRALYQTKEKKYEGEPMVILSTCTYEYEEARLAVVTILKEDKAVQMKGE